MKYNALKGVNDILPPDIYLWQKIESAAFEIFSAYGFIEIRLPIIESTEIFKRSIGEKTDIVEKEMYTFTDKGERSITLRPEGTASAVRCYVENHLYNLPSPQKFFYSGPMFRYERPQKGRFRQFYQVGAEVFGAAEPKLDAEMLSMLKAFFEKLGIHELSFEVNSIGCEKCRPEYRKTLSEFFSNKIPQLCPDCNNRYSNNPLRILDCKVPSCIEMRKDAPAVKDSLCNNCKGHFEKFLSFLKLLNIKYSINPNLVRGLDYYTSTTFEITSEHLGAQKAVAAGGRYDRLVEEFGGPPTPAIGFAIGMERLAEIMKNKVEINVPVPSVFFATIGENADKESMILAEKLRAKGIRTETGYASVSLKNQLRKADKLNAEYVFILGDDELKSGKIKWKNLKQGSEGEIDITNIGEFKGFD
ncbi:MAG: histidine--tRNA ligase [Nitrospiraceae bacterium]|nr:histidine--tRNA ligase [Nitrospiraceae bacterium]